MFVIAVLTYTEFYLCIFLDMYLISFDFDSYVAVVIDNFVCPRVSLFVFNTACRTYLYFNLFRF